MNANPLADVLADFREGVARTCACGESYTVLRAFVARDSGRCPGCEEKLQHEKAAAVARDEAERRTRLGLPELLQGHTFDALAQLERAERARRVKDPAGIGKARAAVEATRVALLGPAGVGKTTLACCILRAWAARGARGVLVDGYQLATARAQAQLGAEAAIIETAMRSPAAILDDLLAKAANPLHDATADVIFERHQRQRRTVVTCGYGKDEIKKRLGDGIARRIFEGAFIIELTPSRPAEGPARP